MLSRARVMGTTLFFFVDTYLLYIGNTRTPKQILADFTNIWNRPETSSTAAAYATTDNETVLII